jgi:chromosome segregation ATPase
MEDKRVAKLDKKLSEKNQKLAACYDRIAELETIIEGLRDGCRDLTPRIAELERELAEARELLLSMPAWEQRAERAEAALLAVARADAPRCVRCRGAIVQNLCSACAKRALGEE